MAGATRRPRPDLVSRAIALAVQAHAGQRRKDGRTPYIVHPMGVLRHLLSDLGVANSEIACTAVLHDVLEDTAVSAATLRRLFGKNVARWVGSLTLPDHLHGEAVPGEEKTRQILADARTMPWPALLVKLCDRWDNLRDVANAPWGAAKRAYYEDQTRRLRGAGVQRLRVDPPPEALRGPVRRAVGAVRASVHRSFRPERVR